MIVPSPHFLLIEAMSASACVGTWGLLLVQGRQGVRISRVATRHAHRCRQLAITTILLAHEVVGTPALRALLVLAVLRRLTTASRRGVHHTLPEDLVLLVDRHLRRVDLV